MSHYSAAGRRVLIASLIVVFCGLGWFVVMSQRPPVNPTVTQAQAETRRQGNDAAATFEAHKSPAQDLNQAEPGPAGGTLTAAEDRVPRHPSDPLIAGSKMLREQWSVSDALGNRERTATYQSDIFKYPMLRVVEQWSGKSGEMVSRLVMVADHLLAAPRPGVDAAQFKQRIAAEGFTVAEAVGESSLRVSFSTRADDPAELPQRIAALENLVEYAEPDYLVWPCVEPNDPAYAANKLWGLSNSGGVNGYTASADIQAPAAWAIRNNAANVIVAVTDTGIRHDHQDLAPNMWRNPAETAGDGIDNDSDGVVDDVFGYDAYGNDGDPMDDQGHGTHCAGTIGARGNDGVGMTGVAWDVKLMAGRFLGANGGTTSDGIKVIDYARQKGADIISASWGGGGNSLALRNAIAACAADGIPFVAAAGNSGTDNDSLPHYPSSYDLPNIVAVAASDANDDLTSFSCRGRNSVDIAAPGWQIWSCYSGSTTDYRFLHGTSMATPHVSGALALARAEFPEAGVEGLIDALYRSSDKLASLDGNVSSGGRLNLHKLLTDAGLSPPNNQFDTPFALSGNYATWSGGNRTADREPDEASYSPAGEARTMWFAWQAPYDGFASLTTAALGAGQRVVVFSGETRSSLRVIHDTEAAGSGKTTARFLAEAGVHYRIVTASGSPNGELFSLRMELIAANDLLSRAVVLNDEAFETSASNRGATAQPFENAAPHAGVGAGHSVWFRWTAPLSGPFSLNTVGSSTDTVVAVYTGNPSSPGSFTTIGANDDVSATYRWSRVDFEAVEGVSYYIAVDTAMGGVPGSFVLQGASPAPPAIVIQPADLQVASGGRAVFSVGADGTPPLRYQWFRDGEALPGAWETSLVIDPTSLDSLGSYHVVVGNSHGSTASGNAQLTEKQITPSIVWKSGDQSLVVGSGLNLRVEARGSQPMTYEWSRNGSPLAGQESSSLVLSNLSSANQGGYTCRVTNAAGEASATIRVSVVTSPFDSWQWRLTEMPGPAVNDMKVIDNKVHAVCGERIMVSEDGLEWSAWKLPPAFEGRSLNKLDSTWLCTGIDPAGNSRCAISTDGINWALHTPTGLPGTQHPTRIAVFNGRFIGQRAISTAVYGDVYTSTNGIAWTAATLNGVTTSVTANGPFAIGSGMILAGNTSSTNPPRAYRSVNGADWSLIDLPPNGTMSTGTRGATRWDGKFVLFSSAAYNFHGWVSEDGINWTLQTGKSWPGGIDFNGDFVSLGGSQFGGLSVAWAPDPWSATQRDVKPATGDSISAYCAFNDRVIYGTQRGFLGSLTQDSDLIPFGGSVTVPTQIAFLDNRFFLVKNSTNGDRNGTPLVSGDGSTWRKMRPWTWSSESRYSAFTLAGFGGDQFWATHGGTSAAGPARGPLPHIMHEVPTANGLPKGVTSLAAEGSTLLAIANNQLHRSLDGGVAWTPVGTGPVIGNSTIKPAASVMRSGTRWLLTNGAPNLSYEYGFVHYSDDGANWTKTTGKAGFIVPFNGELYGLENVTGGAQAWKSVNNGATWTTVAMHATNKFTNVQVQRLGVFSGSLVALVKGGSVTEVWFSNNGTDWFKTNAPLGIVDFATGLGQFVAYTSTGAVIQAGSPPAGGAAPVVRTVYPVHQSSVVAGSWVEVRGEAFDPEGSAVTLECRVDGQLIGTSGSGAFRFRFRGVNPAGHSVILRATDGNGLIGSDELQINVAPAQGTNLVDSAEGRDYLPRVAMIEFSGAFYALGDAGMLRSVDGLNWEPVVLPPLSSKLKGLAAGNGTLVAQTVWGVLYSTRDGVNWQQVGPATYAGYWIDQPITFSGGRFLVIQQVAGQQAVNYQTSVNGIDWTSSTLYITAEQAVIGHNGVMVSIHENSWSGDKAVWSPDGGNNWFKIPGIERLAEQTLSFAMAYADGIFLIAASDGRIWRSTDGKSWTGTTLPAPLAPGVTVRHASGRFFVGSSTQLLYSAPATINGAWQALSPAVMAETVIHAAGRYIARGTNGMAWSQNGVSWKNTQDGPTASIAGRLAFNGVFILAIDANGAAWSSDNGVKWQRDFNGIAALGYTATQVGQQMAKLGDTMILGGTNGMLLHSDDDGANWQPATVNGAAAPANWHFNRVQVSAGAAIATAAIGTTTEKAVLRSTNGRTWQSVADLTTQRIVDVVANGTGTWLAVGSNAALWRSTDHGVSWQAGSVPSMLTSRAVAWFNNQWIVFGALTNGGASRCWTSPDGLAWTDRGVNGLVNSNNDFFRTEGHGRLVVWNRTDKPVISSDGITWQPFTGYNTYISNSLYWVIPDSMGFLLATPFISAQAPVEMFSGAPNGQSWTKIPNLQVDTVWADIIDGRLFLFSPGRVVEWSERDLELELAPVSMATLGVADVVQSSAFIRNLGPASINGPLDVDGWLSTDGFFGDGNDVYVGRIQIHAPVIAPGGEAAVNLSFELPGKIKPGDSRLVVVLDPARKFVEKNRANNVSISTTPAVRVPQRKLDLLASGNGTVSSDQNAEYYPHGARIALVATPGKGARFAGWGGDAVGSLSETLVIMDADKNVQASFVSTAALTVFTRGGGMVAQSADDGIYLTGSTAQLAAEPLPGWTFDGWSGSLTGNQTAESLLMNSNKVVTARFALGLDAWKNQKFSAAELAAPSISGDSADADGDGLETWREWLRGSDPKNRGSHGQSQMRREGNWIVMTYTRLENMPAGHAVRASASSDLSNWSVPLDERVVGSANGVETIEARVDVTGMPDLFLRIGDNRPAP